MVTKSIHTLRDNPIYRDIVSRQASLWISGGLAKADLTELLALGWANIWNFDSSLDVREVAQKGTANREIVLAPDIEEQVDTGLSHSFVRLYQLSNAESLPPVLRKLKLDGLKMRTANLGGTLFLVGREITPDDLEILAGITDHLNLVLVSPLTPLPVTSGVLFHWSGELESFIAAFSTTAAAAGEEPLLDLKDASGIALPEDLLDQLGPDWRLLTRSEIGRSEVTQEGFDRFLSGEAEWQIFAAGGAKIRTLSITGADARGAVELDEEIKTIVEKLDRNQVDPRNALRQLIVFAEPGSGTTTLLRQAAVRIAQLGFPTLLSNPLPKDLAPRSVGHAIGTIQELWWNHRSGRGDGTGRIPCVVILDTDAEELSEQGRLARILSSIGREVLLVRAVQRSRDEIRDARGVYRLLSNIEEVELLEIGDHLRAFCRRYKLAQIPGREEWQAFHEGMNAVARYTEVSGETEIDEIPHLFLVGLQPFISERVSDINSLEQYYFQRWAKIPDHNVQTAIHIVAAAGVFGISIPYNALRRQNSLDLSRLETPNDDLHRIVDTFIDWRRPGTNLDGWYLRVRHPIVGRLLCRSIDPVEGDVPFRPLLDVVRHLYPKADDLWFAEQLAFRIGRNFKANASSFSLERDTPIQRAARALFAAIPEVLKDISRTIAHHEARFHIHTIHACKEALARPSKTVLTVEQIWEVLDEEISKSNEWLERAERIVQSREPISNVYNTHARLKFTVADILWEKDTDLYKQAFEEGLDLQERSLEGEGANGYALYQFVNEILGVIGNADEVWNSTQLLDLLSRAEARLAELIRLHEENRWRNVDPVDAEVQLGELLNRHLAVLDRFSTLRPLFESFQSRYPEAGLRLKIRQCVGTRSPRTVFRDTRVASALRGLRDELLVVEDKTPRGLLYLYRLYIEDPEGRLDFRTRLLLLGELKRKSPSEFLPYWHDEASLLCQLDNLTGGAQRFAELRAYRRANEAQWFWLNERILLSVDGDLRPKLLTLRTTSTNDGWAIIQNTRVRIKYQPQQFGAAANKGFFRAYVRFTLYGLQAVPQRFADDDLKALGL